MPRGILERLSDGPVLGDGGYLLELEKPSRSSTANSCGPVPKCCRR